MIRLLLLLVLLADITVVALYRQYQVKQWKSIHLSIAGLILVSSGFLGILSLFMVFDSIERLKPSQENEMNDLYWSLLVLGISLVSFVWIFLKQRIT